jgi:RND superfamily putative drug exporter
LRIFNALGHITYRYRWLVVLAWGALLIAGAFFAPNVSDRLKGGFGSANSEAEQVQYIMIEEFGVSPNSLTIVFEGGGLLAENSQFQEAEDRALDEVRELEEVENVIGYSETNDYRFVSEDGGESYALVNFNTPYDDAQDLVDEVREKVRTEELTTYVTGAPAVYMDITEASNEDIRQAEKYAFPLALVILIVAFGSLVAAGIPVLIGGAGVVVTLSVLYFLAGFYDMSVFALTISTMLGLGLGIDYALFAVSRFREELENGRPVSEAVPRTVETAGRSIFFSGTAVLIGLTGLLFFPYMFMRSIGVAGALVVLFSVASALTLLPAVLAILGPKVNALSVRRRRASGTVGAGFWTRSAELVMRHPVSVLLVVGVMLLVLLYPVTHMKVGVPEASVLPEEYESRQGNDILRESFDYASLTPIYAVATLPDDPLSAEGLGEIQSLGERIEETEGIDHVESIYTVGVEAVGRLAQARLEAEAEAATGVDEAVEEQLASLREQYGSVPPGAEEQIRAEAEARVSEELDAQVPELPDGVFDNGTVTPEGVANFLNLPEARNSEELENALRNYTTGERAIIQAVTENSPYTEEARDAVGKVRALEPPANTSLLVGGLPPVRETLSPTCTATPPTPSPSCSV